MRQEVTIDFVEHCPEPDALTFEVPAGTYRVTALGGAGEFMAGSNWNYDGANKGNPWYWRIPCPSLGVEQLASSPMFHPTDEQAFMSLIAYEQTVVLDGTPVDCGLPDTNCEDNRGGATFAIELVCD